LKCATDVEGMTPGVERIIRACARAHHQTGVPISAHADASHRRGLEQQQVLREEGVDLSRVIIGHCGDSTDLDYLMALMDAGSHIGMDRFGLDMYLPVPERIKTIVALIERGYVDKMVLSQDACAVTQTFSREVLDKMLPNFRMTFLFDEVIPIMADYGITDRDIRIMMVENPKRIFSVQGSY
jgi:phosphotriesterase-related protein